MSKEVAKSTTEMAKTPKELFAQPNVKAKFEELLGKRATSFMTSVLQIVSSSQQLANADPASVFHSAAVAATLDLPLNNALGFAYIVPFNQKQPDGSYKQVASFQLGYKGFKQLALRSGQFLTIHASDVREGEILKHDRLTGEIEFSWIADESERIKKKVVGYVSFFKLMNGFSQTFYMTIQELEAHAKKYSQTYKKGFGLWKDDFESMCLKTVTKLNLSKNAPLSVDMQKAMVTDQAVIRDSETLDVSYEDNKLPENPVIDKEVERIRLMIGDAETLKELKDLEKHIPDELLDMYNEKAIQLAQSAATTAKR